MRNLTIRGVPAELAAALDKEKQRRGRSLNQTVLEVLGQSLGVKTPRSNGLRRLAGSWSEAEHEEFEAAVRIFEEPDIELWR